MIKDNKELRSELHELRSELCAVNKCQTRIEAYLEMLVKDSLNQGRSSPGKRKRALLASPDDVAVQQSASYFPLFARNDAPIEDATNNPITQPPLMLRARDIGPPVWTKCLLQTPAHEFIARLYLSGINIEKGPYDKAMNKAMAFRIKTFVTALKTVMTTENEDEWKQLRPPRNLPASKDDPAAYETVRALATKNAKAAVAKLHKDLVAKVEPYNVERVQFSLKNPTLTAKRELPQKAAFGTTSNSKSPLQTTIGCISSCLETMKSGRTKMAK